MAAVMQELRRIHHQLRQRERCRRLYAAILAGGCAALASGLLAVLTGVSWIWLPFTVLAVGVAVLLANRRAMPTLAEAGAYADRQGNLPGTGLALACLFHSQTSEKATGALAVAGVSAQDLRAAFLRQAESALPQLQAIRPGLWPQNARLLLLPLGGILLELLAAWGVQQGTKPSGEMDLNHLIVQEQAGGERRDGSTAQPPTKDGEQDSRSLQEERQEKLRQRLEELRQENPMAQNPDAAGESDETGKDAGAASRLTAHYAAGEALSLYDQQNRVQTGRDIPAEYADLVRDYQNALAADAERNGK